MINDATAREIAGLMVQEHRLCAAGLVADVLMALDDHADAEVQEDWLRIGRAVWRTLHDRRGAGDEAIGEAAAPPR